MIKNIGDDLNGVQLFPAAVVKLEDSAVQVAKKLASSKERRVIVVDNKKFPVGIISITDINDRVVAKGKDISKISSKDFMSSPLRLVVDVNEKCEVVLRKMIKEDNYFVPVVDKGILKGLVTYASVAKLLKNR